MDAKVRNMKARFEQVRLAATGMEANNNYKRPSTARLSFPFSNIQNINESDANWIKIDAKLTKQEQR